MFLKAQDARDDRITAMKRWTKRKTRYSGIYRRGDSYVVVLTAGYGPDGRKRQLHVTCRTLQEALDTRARLRAQVAGGGLPAAPRLTVAQLLDRWLRDYARGAVAPTTYADYERIVRRHLTPALGSTPLRKLTPAAIQAYYSAKLASGLSTTTVRYHHVVLREALQHGVRWGLLAANPADRTSPPRPRKPEHQVLDTEQVRLFLAEARRSSPYYSLYLAAVLTGMRAGELLGLAWDSVDLVTGALLVRRTLYRLGRQILLKEPKSRASRRMVPIPPVLVEELLALRRRQEETRRQLPLCPDGINCRDAACAGWHETGLVFTQANGKPLHLHNVAQGDFKRVLRRAGLPLIRFHDLRHGHATWLLAAGVHPKVTQERLGHSSVGITLDLYSHTVRGLQERAAQELEERLGLGRLARGWHRAPSGGILPGGSGLEGTPGAGSGGVADGT